MLVVTSDALLVRYAASLVNAWPWLAAAAAALVLFAVTIRLELSARRERRAAAAVMAVIALLGVLYAWHLRWLSDDAFISFRYANNWAEGRGLVFNPGERVEGYTNFLWTALMTLGVLVGVHPGQLSIVLTLACLAGSIAVCHVLARRLLPPAARLPGTLAGAGLAASYTFASFGTSGLETVPAALLVLVAVERAEAGAVFEAAVAGVLATLTHPDHALFYVSLGATLALLPPPRARRLLLYAAPFVLLYVPYYLVRWAYYGDFFPNTYYAKSGDSAYFSQGFVYIATSAVVAGLVGVLPLAAFGIYVRRDSVFARFVLLSVPLYLLYVAKVGGDFMLGRLLCVVLPLLFLAAELGIRTILASPKRGLGAAGLAALAPVAVPNGTVPPRQDYHFVSDERTWYPLESFHPLVVDEEFSKRAAALARAFRNAPRIPRMTFCCVGIVGYVTGFELMDALGLVNRSVAHMPIGERGRPGHEKVAGPGYTFEYGADFADRAIWPGEYAHLARFPIGGFDYWLAKYDRNLLEGMARARGTRSPDIEGRIRRYAPLGRGADELACDLWFFDQIYFSHQPNAKLRADFLRTLGNADPSLRGIEELLVGTKAENDSSWRKRVVFAFDDLRGWTRRGGAFTNSPVEHEALGQERVYGQRGQFVNSFHPTQGDGAEGSLLSPTFLLAGDALTLRVGGGQKPGREEIRLRVAGRTVATATGCNSELLGRRVWPIASLRGQNAELEIVDQSEDGWGHIVVDEVASWERLD